MQRATQPVRALSLDLRSRAEGDLTPLAEAGDDGVERFIPTCVGNTQSGDLLLTIISGSSPRAWGTQHQLRGARRQGRFIPTCVGNTCRGTESLRP